MGMDAVELVVEVEVNFGVAIKDAELQSLRTVGDLVAIIRSRIETAKSSTCVSLPAFISLRRLVREVVDDDALRVRPRDRVAVLLSPKSLRELWRRLPEILGTTPERLRRGGAVEVALIAASLGILAVANWMFVLPLSLFVSVLLIVLLYFFASSLKTVPPNGLVTFADITGRIVGTCVASKNLNLDDDIQVFLALRPIIMEQLAVDADEVSMESRFAEDLGLE